MCTVTYLPGIDQQYMLTTSRDEQTTRPSAARPAFKEFNDYSLLYPMDPKGGGTWIACNNTGKTACLFNGAFKAHKPQYLYRKSRGIIVLDSFKFDSMEKFSEDYDFVNIEPFTLIVIDGGSLQEFKWDGETTYLIHHNCIKPKIWSSVTLYSPDIIKLRESWFNEWRIKHPVPLQSDILDFHLSAGDGNKEYDVLMERKALSLRTVSITSVTTSEKKTTMVYMDLLNNTTTKEELYHKKH